MKDGEILKRELKRLNLGATEVAKALDISRNTVYAHQKSKSITVSIKEQYAKLFGVDWASYRPKGVHIINEGMAEYGRSIPAFDTEVFATISPAMSDVVALKPETFINIPMFSRGEYAVQVTGNSMKGAINHGDWIVIRRIRNKDFIVYGEAYLLVTKSDHIKTVKYLNEHEDKSLLWLSPHNSEQFTSQEIDKQEILELYKVEGVLRRM